ncbi:hypothetical protein [Anthocerotibacter panamensis]|uniref:hypothetical protein n=1 Tax=Anthocerotibacter panamensis TaxID=2857077 RepID=UPI001C403F86|nr:hypothetical protein [Anthocerotibacter panamensis]
MERDCCFSGDPEWKQLVANLQPLKQTQNKPILPLTVKKATTQSVTVQEADRG